MAVNHSVHQLILSLNLHTKIVVAELIDKNNGTWKEQEVKELFLIAM